MAIANEERGEISISLGGVLYGMRPTWEAIQAFEAPPAINEAGKQVGGTGKSLMKLANAADMSAISTGDCAIIVTECVREWGRRTKHKTAHAFSVEKVGPLILREGMIVVQRKLALMLFLAATGGITETGEVRAQAAKEAKKPGTTADAEGSVESPAPRSTGRRKSSGGRRR